jgi:branched-chain amino acid transport system permease protein
MKRSDIIFFLCLLACLGAPLLAGNSGRQLGVEFTVTLTLAALWNLLAGYAGIVSIGQQAFIGFGGYVLFALVALGGMPVPFALVLVPVAAGLLGMVAAPLLFRLRGPQFAIGSWVFAEIIRLTFAQIPALGGGSGMSLPAAAVLAISPERSTRLLIFYALAALLALIVYGGSWLLLRSKLGLALRAIKDSEGAAASLGVDVRALKRNVYVVIAALTGLAGALMFLNTVRISPEAGFNVTEWTADIIFITVIGGIGRFEGPLIGCLIFFGLRTLFADYAAWYLIGVGIFAGAIMLLSPKGLSGAGSYIAARMRSFELAPRARQPKA